MKHYKSTLYLVILAGLTVIISACGGGDTAGSSAAADQPELLVYTGVTMVKPMTEIAKIIEEQEGCTITIKSGGSGDLLTEIKESQAGDLYLPGSDSYIKQCEEEKLVTESAHVGFNKAAMMVQKGNPKNISADLESLLNPEYTVIIGDHTSGSIGKETQKILANKRIYEKVRDSAVTLAAESKDMMDKLKNKEADLIINWYATATWPENVSDVEAIPIDEEFAPRKKLVLGLLTISKNPELAQKFMAYAASTEGKDIFNKYGLYDIQ
jgi:molybdate transport system substrate-binding protein